MPACLLLAAAATGIGGALSGCGVRQLNLEDPEDLARLYQRRCGSCHALIAPGEYSMDDWPLWLDEFGPRSGLTERERSYLEPWLIARASDAPRPAQPDLPSAVQVAGTGR